MDSLQKKMSEKAFVLINTEVNATVKDTLREIVKVNGVVEAFALYGMYEIVVKLKAQNIDELRASRDRIRALHGVLITLTLVCEKEILEGDVKSK